MYEPVEVHRVSSDYSKACSRFVKVRFDCVKTCCQLAEVWDVGFVYHIACIRLVGIRRICFDLPQNVFKSSRCGLYRFVECVLFTTNSVGGLYRFGESIFTAAKLVGSW